MTRDQIEEQILDQETIITVGEMQLKLPPDKRQGEKDGRQIRANINEAKKRKEELQRWLQSGLYEGRGGSPRRLLRAA